MLRKHRSSAACSGDALKWQCFLYVTVVLGHFLHENTLKSANFILLSIRVRKQLHDDT